RPAEDLDPAPPNCHDPSPEPPHIVHQPPDPQKTPDALPNFRPCPAPILANSDASPANSNSPLANFDAFPAATDTYPGSPNPENHPRCSRSSPPIINSTPWFL
ncbi:hypothetical protein C0989_010971, partial [Termitomyces sp. Mn162]